MANVVTTSEQARSSSRGMSASRDPINRSCVWFDQITPSHRSTNCAWEL